MLSQAAIAIGCATAALGLVLGSVGWLYVRRYRRKYPDHHGNWKATKIGLVWVTAAAIVLLGGITSGFFLPSFWPTIFILMCALLVALTVVAKVLESRGIALFLPGNTGA